MYDSLDRKNTMSMKLLHYFITEKNYNPIILQGADNEIWLENLNGDYKIVRIVSNHIHNEEQLDFDMFKTNAVVKKIKKKTLSFRMNVLSIFTDLEEGVELENVNNIDCVYLYDEKDIAKYDFLNEYFPDLSKKMEFSEEGFQLFMKITSDINSKNKKDAIRVDEVFKPKKPIVTYVIIAINVLIGILMYLCGHKNYFLLNYSLYGYNVVELGEWYRLLTSAFLHGGIIHLIFNMYALRIIGAQIESYMGKLKYIAIYLFSAISGSLLSILFTKGISVGASGAIFGLLGSLLYFGYHYRVYLGGVLKSQIIPLIVINLLIGFFGSEVIDNWAHIGGLIGGALITIGVGVKYKSSKFEMTNGLIVAFIYIAFLVYVACNYLKFS